MSLLSLEISNFKRFPFIRLPLDKDTLVICGPNGSGKTQLLWATLLFFRAHNLHYPQSSRHTSKLVPENGIKYLDLRQEAPLLLHPSLENAKSFADFIHRGKQGAQATFTCLRDDNTSLTVTLRANGVFNLLPDEAQNVEGKFQYAFMGPDFHFSNANEGPVNPVTSNHPHIRTCAFFLSTQHLEAWKDLCAWMRSLFPSILDITVKGNSFTGFSINVTEKSDLGDNIILEIKNMGAAFQKIFTAFVLLSLLLQPRILSEDDPSNHVYEEKLGQYFLIEEPEAYLYPLLVTKFCDQLKRVCHENKVRLLIVSNSPAVIDTTADRLVLSGRIAGTDSDEAGFDELGIITSKATIDPKFTGHIIIHEGPDDVTFLNHVAPLFGVSMDESQVRFLSTTGSGNLKRPEFQNLLGFLRKQYQLASVMVILDRDFDFHNTHSHSNLSAPVIWDLPSIESYVFVYYCLDQKARKENPLLFLRDLRTYTKFIVEYIQGLGSNKQGHAAVEAATKSIGKEDPQVEDFVIVSMILHGKTWVEHEASVEGLKGTKSVNFKVLLEKYITKESLARHDPNYSGHHLKDIIHTLFKKKA